MQNAYSSEVRVNPVDTRFGLKVYFENLSNDFEFSFADGVAILQFQDDILLQDLRLLTNKKEFIRSVQLEGNKLIFLLTSPNEYLVEKFTEDDKRGVLIRTKDNTPQPENKPKTKVKLPMSIQNLDKDRTLLKFDWKNDVGAAAYLRDGIYYIVFNNPFTLQLSDSKSSNKFSIEQVNDNIISLRLPAAPLNEGTSISMYKQDKTWIFDTSATIAKNEVRVFSRPYAAPYPRVELEFLRPNNQEIITFVDPTVGDELYIITTRDSVLNTNNTYKYIDFNILPSLQGALVQKISDSIVPNIKEHILAISGAGSLNISPKQLRKSTKKFAEVETNFNLDSVVENGLSILSLRNFVLTDEHFLPKIAEIRQALSSATSIDVRLKIYANWALYYLANGFYKEGLIITKLMQQEDPDYSENYNIKLIRSALYFMDKNYFEAQKILKTIEIADIPLKLRKEIRFWQTLVNYKLSEHVVNLEKVDPAKIYLEDSLNFLSEYPDNFAFEFGLDILDTKLHAQDENYTLKLFERLSKFENAESALQNRLLNYKAIFLSNHDKQDAAIEDWDLCIGDTKDVENVVVCRYEKNAFMYSSQRIDKDKYIDELEKLVLVWKGGNLEMKMLDDLGNTYAEKKDYINALRSWKKIIDKYPFTTESLRLSKLMGKTFLDYFTGPESTNIDNFEAVAAFYEFESLVPVGSEGDELVLRFIDHLIALDLLEKAEELLKHQINFRLEGNAKERAINRLAKVYVLDQHPDLARDAIELGDFYEELPDSIAIERRHINAEAFHQNEEPQKAIELLRSDFSPEADDIRSEVYWWLKNWNEFNKNTEPRIYAIRYRTERLDDKDLERVLRLTVSYLINNKKDLLLGLISDFKARVPNDNKKGKIVSSLFDTISELNDLSVDSLSNVQATQDKIKNLMDAMKVQ